MSSETFNVTVWLIAGAAQLAVVVGIVVGILSRGDGPKVEADDGYVTREGDHVTVGFVKILKDDWKPPGAPKVEVVSEGPCDRSLVEILRNPMKLDLHVEWQLPALDMKAIQLWVEYYDATETFDRVACQFRSPITGDGIPMTFYEHSVCGAYARKCHRLMVLQMQAHGISKDVMKSTQEDGLREHERKFLRSRNV